jgi:hypothetical protein
VWYKWRDNRFYAGWVHALAITLAQVLFPFQFRSCIALTHIEQ